MKRSLGSRSPSKMQDGIENGDGSASTSRSVTSTVNGSHNFVIQGFSLAKGMGIGRYITSETFAVGGYQWAIYFYPDGKRAQHNSLYVSAFIALASEGTKVRAVFELTLVDQSGKGEHNTFHTRSGPGLKRGPYTLKHRGSMWGYGRFRQRAALEKSNYLKDDCLILSGKVGVVESASEYARLRSLAVPESELALHFGALLEDQETSDVIFDVGGEKFHAHKLVLAGRSPVFRAKFFESSDQNNVVIIREMEPTVFKAMLHYIYTDTLLDEDSSSPNSSSSTTKTLTERLLVVADAYGLRRLRLLCESKLCRSISVSTFGPTFALAESCHATDLKAACLKFAAQNIAEVMRSNGFEYLKEKCPLFEVELLKAVVSFQDDSSSGESCSSVWAQINDGTE